MVRVSTLRLRHRLLKFTVSWHKYTDAAVAAAAAAAVALPHRSVFTAPNPFLQQMTGFPIEPVQDCRSVA